jgi:hypothetical protein
MFDRDGGVRQRAAFRFAPLIFTVSFFANLNRFFVLIGVHTDIRGKLPEKG